MMDFSFSLLEPLRFPLVTRFYKSHYPAGKPKKDEVIWTAEKQNGIIGAVRFKQFDHFQLLTGMVVQPAYRGQKLSNALMDACHDQIASKPCYCLAFRYLESLYSSAGFRVVDASDLPAELQGRYQSYCSSGKDLIPMVYKSELEQQFESRD